MTTHLLIAALAGLIVAAAWVSAFRYGYTRGSADGIDLTADVCSKAARDLGYTNRPAEISTGIDMVGSVLIDQAETLHEIAAEVRNR